MPHASGPRGPRDPGVPVGTRASHQRPVEGLGVWRDSGNRPERASLKEGGARRPSLSPNGRLIRGRRGRVRSAGGGRQVREGNAGTRGREASWAGPPPHPAAAESGTGRLAVRVETREQEGVRIEPSRSCVA